MVFHSKESKRVRFGAFYQKEYTGTNTLCASVPLKLPSCEVTFPPNQVVLWEKKHGVLYFHRSLHRLRKFPDENVVKVKD